MNLLRFLVDVNVGLAVAESLRSSGHDVVFAGDLDWRMTDADMLALAKSEQRIILTMDADFGELVYHSGQSHAGVLLLRMPGAVRDEKIRVMHEITDRYRSPQRQHRTPGPSRQECRGGFFAPWQGKSCSFCALSRSATGVAGLRVMPGRMRQVTDLPGAEGWASIETTTCDLICRDRSPRGVGGGL